LKPATHPLTPIPANDPRVARAAAAVLAAADSLAAAGAAPADPRMLAAAERRGYFIPEEDEAIRARYRGFLAGRAALLGALESMESACGSDSRRWSGRLPALAVGLAAACLLLAGSRDLILSARGSRLLRKKLDEPDTRRGIPRKTFARLYRGATHPRRLVRFREALEFYREHRERIHDGEARGRYAELRCRLDEWLAAVPIEGLREVLRNRLEYRWFSFRRRHHSAWKQAVFGIFEDAGRRIADLRQPGLRPAPKRVTAALRMSALEHARPGDVFVTRHDDALSNLFLPGFWPHAALHIGDEEARRALGLTLPREAADPARFLEAKKDGVRFRPAEETLAVDQFVILRPPLADAELAAALGRAATHAGKLYDFVFDFRGSDRLVCTEVIYRTYHGAGALDFRLIESGGRLCLPAEELIDQALALGFRIVATVNVGRHGLLAGDLAHRALRETKERA